MRRVWSDVGMSRCDPLCMRSIPSAAIAKIGDTSGVYRREREAGGFMATYVKAEYLTVQTRKDVTPSHMMSADEASGYLRPPACIGDANRRPVV